MNRILKTYNRLASLPLGRRIFSFLACVNAPYFSTIKPLFISLEPGRCEILMKKRRSVTNHLKTVDAIAMCNLVELAGGVCTDVSLPDDLRWIPRGMTVEYIALAKTDLKGVCLIDTERLKNWNLAEDFPAEVNCYDTSGNVVMRGIIKMHISRKR